MKILFVCTGNLCRSPMAEGYFNHLSRGKNSNPELQASSAGLHAAQGYSASENAVKACAEDGIDISAHRSSPVSREAVDGADLILTMTGLHREEMLALFPSSAGKIHTVKAFIGKKGDIADPLGFDLETYRRTYREIKQAVAEVFEKVSPA